MDVRERTLAGRYRLHDVIGRGGMSVVYRGTDEVLGRTVAVKVLLAALAEHDPTYTTRFQREARAAAALACSAVVTVYDTGLDEDGGRYIVMEYVPGRSLAQLLADERSLEVAECVRIADQVADALRAAHSAGILHRDIKPANVMLADDGTVKVLDFGIARRLDGTTVTQAASVLGTAAYMAPERALGQPGDERSDIYSLGCLLYAMLTGRPPFSADASAAVLHQQVNSQPDPPSQMRPELPSALDSLVIQILAKAPDARPRSAAEVRDRLRRLSGVPTLPAGAPGRTAVTSPLEPTAPTKRVRRSGRAGPALATAFADHRWRAVLMGLATALVALLVLALLAGGGSSGRHRRKAHRASQSTSRTITHTAAKTAPPKTTSTPAVPAAAGPPAHGGPPGHGGRPPGKAKKGHGPGDGGPAGGDGGG